MAKVPETFSPEAAIMVTNTHARMQRTIENDRDDRERQRRERERKRARNPFAVDLQGFIAFTQKPTHIIDSLCECEQASECECVCAIFNGIKSTKLTACAACGTCINTDFDRDDVDNACAS